MTETWFHFVGFKKILLSVSEKVRVKIMLRFRAFCLVSDHTADKTVIECVRIGRRRVASFVRKSELIVVYIAKNVVETIGRDAIK